MSYNDSYRTFMTLFVYLLNGFLNNGILGGKKVKITNKKPINKMSKKAILGLKQLKFSLFNRRASSKNVKKAETKKIAILTRSGVFPNTPLRV